MLQIGIVGLPNVGKSTLFNALTKKGVPAENYPFCTIDPSVGIVAVPDERLEKLSVFSQSQKTIPAAIEFVDIAGLVKGASSGEGLGNQFLSHIREVDAIAEMVRIFEDGNVTHVEGNIDPLRDIEIINLELILADSETVTKRLGNIERDVKRGDKLAIQEKNALTKVSQTLQSGKLASLSPITPEELPFVKQVHLLTMKSILYVLNKKVGAKNLDEMNDERFSKLLTFFKEQNASYVIIDAGIEQELNALSPEEKKMMRVDLGTPDDGIDKLIKESYSMLNLITYFTTGEAETRAWTIKKNSTAPIAGAAIHTDFEKKFIRAEVIFWEELLSAGSFARARELGLIRTEGREYIVKDGDTIEFKV